MNNIHKIAGELSVQIKQVEAVVELLESGATVPFISRYRKEMTGSLDEVAVAAIRDRSQQLQDLDKRKEAILKSIKEQEKLTPELEKEINAAETMARLEDIYLPYKPKRRTKGTIAKEKGLEPLAKKVFEQIPFDLQTEAAHYIDEEKEVVTIEDALHGARDIMAEWINENAVVREALRKLFYEKGRFYAKVLTGKEQEGHKYKDYFEWDEAVKTAPSHRVLAMRRGEKEMILMLDIKPEEEDAIALLERHFVKAENDLGEQVRITIADAYKRLLKPSMETEIRILTKKKADEEAIKVFSENLRQLLLSAPLGQKNVMAVDPGFRTGCKLVCLDKQGKLLFNEAIYPHEPQRQVQKSAALILQLVSKYNIEAIAIGNGTAGRETEKFMNEIGLPKNVMVVMVNESGASIYSASDIAREEFSDYDLTVRGAVSIGRRLMDPLAELVKIDAKSIGVGQYQHDVDQNLLKSGLDDTVMSCVNAVGVEVNTASKQLLTYVSGLGPQIAQNIVDYRNENGPFKSKNELKKVPRLGDKAYEQAAGFLRIGDAANPLDSSAVHPESYNIVEQMAKDVQASVKDLMTGKELREQLDMKKYITETIGLPTLKDIMQELAKPGRDPREQFEAFSFTEGVNKISELKVGMKLPGIITNITNFGAFVDVGVHQDGLVHVSHLADKFVSNPAEVVSVQQKVQVTVLEVDESRKRISLSLKKDPFSKEAEHKPKGKFNKKKEEKTPEGDFQSKLAALKGKFG
ncbi:RNA-binding transcriptional accessory protein [Marivirga sp. S37H4]|uniref:RNA-binding transcriptional accessory protein n=1 Tax=Marivirga aurantiaca TaxID=2802615 RepID=A0A935C6U8_9BACT|nr:Tex family protein [Marivirga aurantiaca]MBK6264641.1 RNA-binding transcriptional accessory protein [Marivirga aurantiaca]